MLPTNTVIPVPAWPAKAPDKNAVLPVSDPIPTPGEGAELGPPRSDLRGRRSPAPRTDRRLLPHPGTLRRKSHPEEVGRFACASAPRQPVDSPGVLEFG